MNCKRDLKGIKLQFLELFMFYKLPVVVVVGIDLDHLFFFFYNKFNCLLVVLHRWIYDPLSTLALHPSPFNSLVSRLNMIDR